MRWRGRGRGTQGGGEEGMGMLEGGGGIRVCGMKRMSGLLGSMRGGGEGIGGIEFGRLRGVREVEGS